MNDPGSLFWFRKAAVVVFALICALEDGRRRRVGVDVLFLFSAAAVFSGMLLFVSSGLKTGNMTQFYLPEFFFGGIPALLLLFLSFCGAGVGSGDGFYYAVLFLYSDVLPVLPVFLFSAMAASMFALILIVGGKEKKKKQEIPFLLISAPIVLLSLL